MRDAWRETDSLLGLVWFEVLLSLLGLSNEMFKSDEVK